MVERIVHLGFEVRVELVRDDGERMNVQITRDEAERLELERGQIVFVKPTKQTSSPDAGGQCGSQASGSPRERRRPAAGSVPRRDVGERHGLEHTAQARPNGDPDLAQRRCGPGVLDLLRSARRERSRAGRRRRESPARG